MKRSNSDDFLMTAIIMAEGHGNCCSDNALYKNGLLLLLRFEQQIKKIHIFADDVLSVDYFSLLHCSLINTKN